MASAPTNAAFLAAVQAMTVTGVNRHYDEPPASVDISDGYAAFPLMPSAGLGEFALSCTDSNKTRTVGYVVIIEAAGQGTQAQNYGKLAAAMDNLEAALDGLTVANFIEYDITTGSYLVGESAYWSLIAEIRARSV